jgi:hypothetical protein
VNDSPPGFLASIVGAVASLAVVFAVVFVAGYAWSLATG